MEPLYNLKENLKRALIPKIITYIVLGVIFYLGVMLNIYLLELPGNDETVVNIISLVIITILIVVGIFNTWRKSSQDYVFYQNKIVKGNNELTYLDIVNTEKKKDFIDKIMGTYHINLTNNFKIEYIKDEIEIGDYLQQLITFNSRNVVN
jgi:hypothetical protein